MSKGNRRQWARGSGLGGVLPGGWAGRRAARRVPPFRPLLEELEGRLVPSVSVTASLLADIYPGGNPNPRSLTNVNGILFFSARDSGHGIELWKSDGTSSGTTLVNDINPGAAISNPAVLTNVSGALFFVANDGSH